MTLGESAGRTAGNRPRSSARRRMDVDERAQHTHLKDDPQEWPGEVPPDKLTIRGWVYVTVINLVQVVVIYSLLWLALATGGWPSRIALGAVCAWSAILLTTIILSRATRRPPSGTGLDLPDRRG